VNGTIDTSERDQDKITLTYVGQHKSVEALKPLSDGTKIPLRTILSAMRIPIIFHPISSTYRECLSYNF
jgi:hypothetical protein